MGSSQSPKHGGSVLLKQSHVGAQRIDMGDMSKHVNASEFISKRSGYETSQGIVGV